MSLQIVRSCLGLVIILTVITSISVMNGHTGLVYAELSLIMLAALLPLACGIRPHRWEYWPRFNDAHPRIDT